MKNRRNREVAKRSLAICLLAALLLVGTAVGEVSREGLVGEWHFNEGTGNIVKDSTGNGNNGIIYGAAYVNGLSENALSFDGVDDYVEFSYDTDFTPGSNSWTIEAWVKIDSSKDMDIISWYRCGANPDCNTPDSAIYELFINNDGKAGWKVGDDNGNSYQITSPSPITDNKWHFLTATFSSSSDSMKLYVDGKLSNDKSATLTTLSAGTIPIPLEIGRVYRKGWAPSGGYFNGIIDEVRIYNRALTASEIKELYDADSMSIKVTPTPPTPPVDTSSSEGCPTSSAVLLHGEKTDVVMGEDILLKLSAVNLITKPPMSVQVMIYPPSGMSVTSSDFVKSGAGIYTTTYMLNPGDGKNIMVNIKSNQIGDFNVTGRIVYYFGEDKDKSEDCTLNLPIKVRKKIESPGFGAAPGAIAVLFTILLLRRR